MAHYLLGSGGKRLRPALLLLTAGYAGYSGPSAIRLGASVELIHSATLIHDDVIDGADTRRGQPSANSRWGNHRSVLAGDWLYMQSFQMALAERNFKVLDILIDLTQSMVEGEVVQLSTLGRMDLREEEVIELAARKTACLFSGCARLGAVLGRVSDEEEQRLADYGRYAGVAFQLVDDLLDFTASPTQLGKPVLSDLKEGKVTLPLVYALESAKNDGAAGRAPGAHGAGGEGLPERSPGGDFRAGARFGRAGPHPATGSRLCQPRQGLPERRRRRANLAARWRPCPISFSTASASTAPGHAAVQAGLPRPLRPAAWRARFPLREVSLDARRAGRQRHCRSCRHSRSRSRPAMKTSCACTRRNGSTNSRTTR